jgi:hypothetical protein
VNRNVQKLRLRKGTRSIGFSRLKPHSLTVAVSSVSARFGSAMSVHDGGQVSGFAKLIAKPSAQFSILDSLHRKSDACRENLPNPLFARPFGTMVRHALAELRHHDFKRFLSFMVHEADDG